MARRITQLLVFRATGYTCDAADQVEVQVPGMASPSHDLLPHLERYPRVRKVLGELPEMTLQVHPFVPWVTERALQVRQRIYAVYDDGSYRPWRVVSIGRSTGQGTPVKVACIGMEQDLQDTYLSIIRTPSKHVDYTVPRRDIALSTAFGIVMAASNGVKSVFTQGTVDAAFSGATVNLNARGNTHLALLSSLVLQVQEQQDTTCELDFAFTGDPTTGGTPGITVSIVERVGLASGEAPGGDPSLRPIDEPTGYQVDGEGNLQKLNVEENQDNWFTRVIPFADGGESAGGPLIRLSLSGANLPIDSVGASSVTMKDNVIGFPDMWKDYKAEIVRENGQTQTGLIDGVTEPNVINFSLLTPPSDAAYLRLIDPNTNAYVTYVYDPAAEAGLGVIAQRINYDQIVPVTNLLDTLADWSPALSFAGTPADWTLTGVTLTDVTDDLYVSYGDGAKKLEFTAAGDTVEIGPYDLTGLLDETPVISLWLAAVGESGRVRVTIVDSEAVEHPVGDEQAEILPDQTRAWAIGGLQVAEGEVTIKLEAIDGPAVIHLDALTLTVSGGPWRYDKDMGRARLYMAALATLKKEGGKRPPSYDTDFFDVAALEGASGVEEVEIGSAVQLRALFDASSGSYLVDFAARVYELVETEHPRTGRLMKLARFEEYASTFEDRLVERSPPAPGDTGGGVATSRPFGGQDWVCGDATVVNGTSTVTVTEADTKVPFDQALFILTPMSAWGGASEWWVEPTTVTATSFEIRTDVAVTADFTFKWWAIKDPEA